MLILKFIFQGWPETAALIFLAFSMVGYKPNLRESVSYSLLLVTIIYLFRMPSIPFGLHTIVGVITLVILVYRVTKVSLGISFLAAFSTYLILAFMETLFSFLFEQLIGNISMSQGWLWIIVGWPQILGLVGSAIVIRKIHPILIKKVVK